MIYIEPNGKYNKSRAQQEKEIMQVLRVIGIIILSITAVSILFILLGLKKPFIAVGSFVAIGAAYTMSGLLIGFLFGIPRSEKYRYRPNNTAADKPVYSENTNLEEISDWLTKIIVGLTLVQFRELLAMLDQSAKSISRAILSCSNGCQYHAFSYALIIFYLAAGFGIGYLWTRTRLPIILITGKKEEEQAAIDENTANLVSASASKELIDVTAGVYDISSVETARNKSLTDLKEKATKLSNERTPKDKTDIQKGRWGGLKENNGKRIEGFVKPSDKYNGFYDIKIRVSASTKDNSITGEVAFFVHDSFGFENNIICADVTPQGFAEIPLVAYEAFTVGALTEDGTELELDLNTEKGYPEGFYWKEQ